MTDPTVDSSSGDRRHVFDGLAPTVDYTPVARPGLTLNPRHTVPVLLVGSLAAMSLNLTGQLDPADLPRDSARGDRPTQGAPGVRTPLGLTTPTAPTAEKPAGSEPEVAAMPAPSTYTVAPGDTVSDIAVRYGLATASVLALNGLSWSSLIFPGQVLKLSSGSTPVAEVVKETPAPSRYTIVPGDTISAIAERHGVPAAAILSANGLSATSIIYPGQTLAIPEVGPAPAAPEPSSPELISAPSSAHSYVVVDGDTLSGIAARHGLGLHTLLEANGLSTESVIFSGDILTLPARATVTTASAPSALDSEMRDNAATIIRVGRELGVPEYGIVIALATAMQESTLRNLDWGDRDSVGLFQQRPSSGWGSVDQLTTPEHAARLFYGGPNNPNAGFTRGLLDIQGWESMPVTVAAQAVQISAYPDAYAKWESAARSWLAELG